MSTAAIEKLMFTVGLTDMVSQPLMSINKTIGNMKANATGGFDAMRGGAIGLAGSLFSVKELMSPVYEMQQALGEVRSLNVADSALQQLEKTSLEFSMRYGESAARFVKSSYDIQSAIGGLTDNELSQFTLASNILAKGTKADAATVTSYMGTMYGIFKTSADAMGKAEWVNRLTGQTAEAVRMFKTDGQQMSGAFTSLGANATASGVALTEQMAILGTLQATMSGSEAGTKYRSFLANAAKAQETLGLQFTDSQGRLLPMVDILQKLQGRYGNTFDEIESMELAKAFGTQEAVGMIKLLMNDTAGLAKNINALGKINGMQNAENMAKDMVDPWEQFKAVTEALRISFGNSLLPTINDVLTKMSDGLTTVYGWTQEFPNITKWVGLATLTMLGMSAATGAFSIILGLSRTAMAAFGGVLLLGKGIMALVAGAMWLFAKRMLIWNGIMKAARTAMLLFSLAMYINPIGLVVAGITALVGVFGYLIYRVGKAFGWWDKLAAKMGDIAWLKPIQSAFNWILEKLEGFAGWLGMDLGISEQLKTSMEIEQTVTGPAQTPFPEVGINDLVPKGFDPALFSGELAITQTETTESSTLFRQVPTEFLNSAQAQTLPAEYWQSGNNLFDQSARLPDALMQNSLTELQQQQTVTLDVNDLPLTTGTLEHTKAKIDANITVEPKLLQPAERGIHINGMTVQANDTDAFLLELERQAELAGG